MAARIHDTMLGSPENAPISDKILRLDRIQRPELRQWYQPGQDLWYENPSKPYSHVFIIKIMKQ
jgi:hypothetical protein